MVAVAGDLLQANAQGLAEQFQRCVNLPSVQGPEAIVQAIITHIDMRFDQLNTRMDTLFDRIQQRLDASDQNAIARVQNSLLDNPNEVLTPLVNPVTNDLIPNFPATSMDIDGLDDVALSALLATLRTSLAGNMAQKRQRLRVTVGLMPTRRTVTTTGA